MERRALLGSLVTGLTAGVAGCSSPLNGDSDADPTPTGDEDETTDPTPTGDEGERTTRVPEIVVNNSELEAQQFELRLDADDETVLDEAFEVGPAERTEGRGTITTSITFDDELPDRSAEYHVAIRVEDGEWQERFVDPTAFDEHPDQIHVHIDYGRALGDPFSFRQYPVFDDSDTGGDTND